MIDAIARFLTSPFGAGALSAIIALGALATYWLGFYRRTQPLISDLEEANQRLETFDGESAFANGFEEFNEWLKQNALLRTPWHEFYETLIFPKPEEQRQVIKNSQEASVFFNDQRIIHPRLNTTFYNAFPNYLTGAGILGTFLGLVFGIWLAHKGLQSGNVTEVTKALGNLLGGASLAFTTSIVGIFSSIIFSWREKHRTHRLHNEIAMWNSLLDERLELVTPEQLSAVHLEEAKKQTLQLERFNTDLAVSIAKALDEKLDEKIAGRIGPALDSLINTVEGIRKDRGETNQRLLENIVEEFKISLSGATGSEMNSIALTLKKLDETLRGATLALSAGQKEMHETTRKIATSVETAIHQGTESMHEEMAKAMHEMTVKLKSASEGTAEKLKQAGSATYSSISKATETFERSVTRLVDITNQVQALMQTTQETLHRMNILPDALDKVVVGFQTVSEPLHETASSIKEAAISTQQTMEDTARLVQGLKSMGGQMEATSDQLQQSWQEYTERFQEVDISLKRVFQEINEGLGNYTERVKDFAIDFDKHMAKAIADLGGAVGQLDETVEDLLEALNRQRR